MEEVTVRLTEAITTMIEAGGPAALWALGIWKGLDFFSTALRGAIFICTVMLLAKLLRQLLAAYWDRKNTRLSLLSEEVSKDLHHLLSEQDSTIETWLTTLGADLGRINQQLDARSDNGKEVLKLLIEQRDALKGYGRKFEEQGASLEEWYEAHAGDLGRVNQRADLIFATAEMCLQHLTEQRTALENSGVEFESHPDDSSV